MMPDADPMLADILMYRLQEIPSITTMISKEGKTIEETRMEVGMTIESIDNIEVAYELGKLHNIEISKSDIPMRY